jgi:polar amino acid transport system substrate-binding protein
MIVEGFKFFVDEKTSGTRIGIPLGEEELTDKVNEIIDEVVKSGTFEQWHKEYSEYAKSLGL